MTPTSRTKLCLAIVTGWMSLSPWLAAQEFVPTPQGNPPPAPSFGAPTNATPSYAPSPSYAGPSNSYDFGASGYSGSPTIITSGENRTYWYSSAEWLFTTRTHAFDTPVQITQGPDALSCRSVPITYKSGYRLRLGISACDGWGIEGVFSDLGNWSNTRTDVLTTGLAFDNGIVAGNPWAGRNFLTDSTFFSPVNFASTVGLIVDENSEFEGFGPNTAFADAPPTFTLAHQSNFWTAEMNFLNHEWNGRVQYGFGYLHAQLIENALASITGTLRAADSGVGVPNAGLSDFALTSGLGGGLNLISGAADGWDDETNPALGPDRVTFSHTASVQNYMNGGQGVLKIIAVDGPRLTIDVTGKGGIYHNRVRAVVQERYSGIGALDNSVYGRDFTSTNDVVSFLGLAGMGGGYKVTPNFLVTAGYDVWFISGVAMASEQIRGIRGNTFQAVTDGSFVAHGLKLGAELRY